MTTALAVQTKARGLESGDNQDLILPKILLMQKLSKFVEEGAKIGSFVNSLTKAEVKDTTFIPIAFSKYFDLVRPEGTKMKFEGRVFSQTDARLAGRKFFSDKDGKATAITVLSVISIMENVPVIIAFSKSSYSAGKKLYTMAAMAKVDLFAKKYKLTSTKKADGDNTWFVMDVEAVGDTSDEEFVKAEEIYNMFGARTADIHAAEAMVEEAFS